MYKKNLLYVGSTFGSRNMSNNQFYYLGWNKITLEHHNQYVWNTISSSTGNMALYIDYIYLDTDERRRFAQVSHEYLIEQVQHDSKTASSGIYELNFNHPVKEIIWTGKWVEPSSPDNIGVGGYNASLVKKPNSSNWLLKLNGHDRFNERDLSYFTKTQIMQYHSGPGGLEVLSGSGTNNFNDTIAVYSFCLKPEEHQPSGTCNFSRIENAQLIEANTTAYVPIEIYVVNYNVLRIMSGMGGLAYSN